jgi:hypothetical protein
MYMNIAAIERVWEAHAAAEFVSGRCGRDYGHNDQISIS